MIESNWRAEMQGVAAGIDSTFGETVVVRATTRAVNRTAQIDNSIRPASVDAVFSWRAEMAFNGNANRGAALGDFGAAPLVSTRKPIFSFRFGVLPFPLRQGYRIERVCDGSTFEITDVKSDGVSRVEVSVVQLGREPSDYLKVLAP